MAPREQSKVCPACGTRNKAKWEFCAKCGESLQKVDVADGATTTATPSIQLSDDAEADGSATGLIATGAFLLAGIVAAVWLMQHNKPAEVPVESSSFQLPTLPPAPLPRASQAPSVNNSFEEGRRLFNS